MSKAPNFSKDELRDYEVRAMREKWANIDGSTHWELTKNEEMEREKMYEKEQEREIERPRQTNPKRPSIHQGLKEIIMLDRDVQALPKGLVPAFELMR